MPLDDVLGEQENFCKTLGQEIFDKFKKANEGQTSAGKEAVINICNAIKFCAKDGFLRKQYVERAWNGIGDDHWRWHC
ncbi:MAG: hypothetical protein KDK55_02410 [Chlamydiia bacterium]|nr:hypothetical protein [Chlamydiia bacterium]